MQSMDRGFESHQGYAIFHLIKFRLFQEQLFIIANGYCSGLGSNTFYQIQIQIQIQKFGFFKYKYKYKYFAQV